MVVVVGLLVVATAALGALPAEPDPEPELLLLDPEAGLPPPDDADDGLSSTAVRRSCAAVSVCCAPM
ncbi:MAG: hypothetical protein ACR2HD_09490 [Solirubrobacteraceae bacterium]